MHKAKCCAMAVAVLVIAVQVYAQESAQPAYAAAATTKFSAFPGVPECAMGAVPQGDPAKGNAVILLKAKPGCVIPWHWHTPSERLIMVSGRAKVEMKDGSPATLRAGDFLNLEAKHIHQFTCLAACMLYDVTGDAPFDIHYVDANGGEISADQALKPKTKAPASKKKTE